MNIHLKKIFCGEILHLDSRWNSSVAVEVDHHIHVSVADRIADSFSYKIWLNILDSPKI